MHREWIPLKSLLLLAQYSNGWISTQLTIVLLKMDQTVSVEARSFSLGEVLCCVECDIFNKKSWKENI